MILFVGVMGAFWRWRGAVPPYRCGAIGPLDCAGEIPSTSIVVNRWGVLCQVLGSFIWFVFMGLGGFLWVGGLDRFWGWPLGVVVIPRMTMEPSCVGHPASAPESLSRGSGVFFCRFAFLLQSEQLNEA